MQFLVDATGLQLQLGLAKFFYNQVVVLIQGFRGDTGV